MDYETYQGLVATLEEMSDPEAWNKLKAAKEASAEGKGVDHETVVAEFRARWDRGYERSKPSC